MSKAEILNKLDDILDNARVNELLGRKKEEEKKCCDKLLWVFAIVGAVVAIAAIAYAMYRYFKPDYLYGGSLTKRQDRLSGGLE